MPSTKSFKETVRLRIERDAAFRLALFQELLSPFWERDITPWKNLTSRLAKSQLALRFRLAMVNPYAPKRYFTHYFFNVRS